MLDGTGKGVVDGIAGLGEGCLAGELGGEDAVSIRIGRSASRQGRRAGGVYDADEMVSQDMLQKEVETMSVVMVAEVAEFVQKDVVLEHARQAHDTEVQIDITLRRSAAPVGGVMLDCHTII